MGFFNENWLREMEWKKFKIWKWNWKNRKIGKWKWKMTKKQNGKTFSVPPLDPPRNKAESI